MTGIQLLNQLLEQEQLNPGVLHKTIFVYPTEDTEEEAPNEIKNLDFTISDRIDINI